jgi:hypothetical protein
MGNWLYSFCRKNNKSILPEQCIVENVTQSPVSLPKESPKEIKIATKDVEKIISEFSRPSRKLHRRKKSDLHSTTLHCSECSSDTSSGSSNASSDFHLTEQVFLDLEATQNIYFDITSLKAKLNTTHIELRDISQHVKQTYENYCKTEKSIVCKLSTVLNGLDIPEDATHLVLSFLNYHGDKFYIPFSLNHPDDFFPFENPEFIVSGLHEEELPESILLMTKNENQDIITKNVTEYLLYFSRDMFSAGFSMFRPYAWTWLSELSEDPDAILITIRRCEEQIKYASLTVYNPTITEWTENV